MKPADKRRIVWEDGGTCLGIRVSTTGKKSFIFMYRFEGRPRMLTVGQYPRVTLATARVQVAQAKEKILKGTDPGQVLLEAKAADQNAFTVKALVDEYIEKWAKPRKRSWKEDDRILQKDVVPCWGKKKAKAITRRDVVVLLDKIVERKAPIQANRTLAVIRKMFNFGVGRSILEANPCLAITSPSKENRRDRVLDEKEIKAFWGRLGKTAMSEKIKLALKLQLITCQRKGEIIAAEWEDLDLSAAWWTIPEEKVKTGIPHRVPLSKLALATLKEIKALSGESQWLFPSPFRAKKTHIAGQSIDHAVRSNQEVFKIPHFVPHDLRRTGASLMTSFGVPRLTVSKILNHVEGGVTSIYDRHTYDPEKRQALDAWGRKLKAILTGEKGKVITLQRA